MRRCSGVQDPTGGFVPGSWGAHRGYCCVFWGAFRLSFLRDVLSPPVQHCKLSTSHTRSVYAPETAPSHFCTRFNRFLQSRGVTRLLYPVCRLLFPVTSLLAPISGSLARTSSYITFSLPIEDGMEMRRNAAFASFEAGSACRVRESSPLFCCDLSLSRIQSLWDPERWSWRKRHRRACLP